MELSYTRVQINNKKRSLVCALFCCKVRRKGMGHKRSALLLIKTNYMSKANNNVVSREMCAPWLVRTTSLYFHKARTLRHTSALLRYNARSLRHRYERAQLTIHFVKEIKKLASRALLSHVSAWKFLRTLEKYEKHSPSARASPHFARVL